MHACSNMVVCHTAPPDLSALLLECAHFLYIDIQASLLAKSACACAMHLLMCRLHICTQLNIASQGVAESC